MRLGDRQGLAVLAVVVLGMAVPIIILVAYVFTALWAWMLGLHMHNWLHGWFSDTKGAPDNRRQVAGRDLFIYWFALINLYLLYQLCELIAWPWRKYRVAHA